MKNIDWMGFEGTKEFFENWNRDPKHWTNNKRRLSGFAPLRGKANKKPRLKDDIIVLYNKLCGDIYVEYQKSVKEYIEQLPSIHYVVQGKDVYVPDTTQF